MTFKFHVGFFGFTRSELIFFFLNKYTIKLHVLKIQVQNVFTVYRIEILKKKRYYGYVSRPVFPLFVDEYPRIATGKKG